MTRRRRPAPRPHRVAVALATLAAAAGVGAEGGAWRAEFRIRWDALTLNPEGPTALASRLSDTVSAPQPSTAALQARLRLDQGPWHGDLQVNASAETELRGGSRRSETQALVNELYASENLGPVRVSAGRRVLQWDVGYGFRPNDIVQQDTRRELVPTKAQGRGVLQLELFGTDTSATVVWVNPQNLNALADEARGPRESALAAMAYLRDGAVDAYAFARRGERTGLSVGAAVVMVVSDSLSLHASGRMMQRHDGWGLEGSPGNAPQVTNPWRYTMLGAAEQGVIGGLWTGSSQQSVLFETWYDGTTLSDAQWRDWTARTGSLAQAVRGSLGLGLNPSTRAGLAGNLAWQALPTEVQNLRRLTHFLRLSWQPQDWVLNLDAQVHPADDGRIVTAGVQWQGEGLRVNAAMRWFGGPQDAVARQLPYRREGLVMATWDY